MPKTRAYAIGLILTLALDAPFLLQINPMNANVWCKNQGDLKYSAPQY